MQEQNDTAKAPRKILCLMNNAVLRLDLSQALEAEGYVAHARAEPAQRYASVILDIDDSDSRHVSKARRYAKVNVPVILIGQDMKVARATGIDCAAFFTKAFVAEVLVSRLKDLLIPPHKDGPERS